MAELLRFVLLGLAVGALYALTAQGLVLIYRSSNVVNLAHGAIGMVGAYVFYELEGRGWPGPTVWLCALGVPVALGVFVQLAVLSRLRESSPVVRLVATLGVLLLLIAGVQKIWGLDEELVVSPLPTTIRHPFGGSVGISEDRLWLIALACVVTVALSLMSRRTRFGLSTIAVAENHVAAAALAISPNRIAAMNWALASALAAVTAILLAPILSLGAAALAFVVLRALAAALVGQFRSYGLTLAGAFGIGVLESVIGRYLGDMGALVSDDGSLFGIFTPQAVSRSTGLLIIIAVLIFAGRSLPTRGDISDRLPALGSGRVRPVAVFGVLLLGLVVLNTVSVGLASALIVTMSVAIILMSIVVLAGYVGQVSLAQMSLAGFGAWVAAATYRNHGVPFLVAVLLGIAATVPLGLIVALPALRTRGASLAVLTFGVAVVLDELIFQNSALNGGLNGHVVSVPSVLGIEMDAFSHPNRYGAVVLVLLCVCGVGVANLRRSPTGRRMIAVRSNERAAAALGISVVGVKSLAFAFAAGMAALGGIALAFARNSVTYTQFGAYPSVEALVYTVIGGVGVVAGAPVGAILAVGGLGTWIVHELGLDRTDLALFGGVILILTIITQPNGQAYTVAEHVKHLIGRRRSRHSADGASHASGTVDDPELAVASVGDHFRGASLVVENLTVRFGGVVAVDDVSLEVRPGEVLGLIGANGAGKTTFVDAVTGFVEASPEATITIDGEPVHHLGASERANRGLGRSFQGLELFEDITVRENLLTGAERHPARALVRDVVRPRGADLSSEDEAIVARLGLSGVLDRKPPELSFGQRRLVSVARALASRPRVLLLDEPAAGLNDHESRELGEVIRWLATDAGLAVLVIEHDVALVMSCSDRVAVLDFGRLIAEGTQSEVTTSREVVAAYLGEDVAPAHEDPVSLEAGRSS